MNTNDYSAYVLSAYGISGLILLALGAWIALGARARRSALKRLEDQGLRRRSAGRAA